MWLLLKDTVRRTVIKHKKGKLESGEEKKFLWKREGEETHVTHRGRRKDNTRRDFKEIGCYNKIVLR